MIGSGKMLITGITGFVGSRVCQQALEAGHHVRGTVRSLQNFKKLKVTEHFPNQQNLEIVEADLLKKETWLSAVAGCKYIIHTASPFPLKPPKKESELMEPAVQGTENILEAAKQAGGVEHIVITSSIAAITSFGKEYHEYHTEEDWATPDIKGFPAYSKSKTYAERAVWEFYNSQEEGEKIKVTVINPGWIAGPSLVDTDFTSQEIPKMFLTGKIPGIPALSFGTVDVRDVAKAHLFAIQKGEIADGKRYICVCDTLWFREMADILREEFTQYGYKVTQRNIPYCGAKFMSFFSNQAKSLLPRLNQFSRYRNDNIKADLGLEFTPLKEAILELAYSLIKFGLIPDKINKGKGKGGNKAI